MPNCILPVTSAFSVSHTPQRACAGNCEGTLRHTGLGGRLDCFLLGPSWGRWQFCPSQEGKVGIYTENAFLCLPGFCPSRVARTLRYTDLICTYVFKVHYLEFWIVLFLELEFSYVHSSTGPWWLQFLLVFLIHQKVTYSVSGEMMYKISILSGGWGSVYFFGWIKRDPNTVVTTHSWVISDSR